MKDMDMDTTLEDNGGGVPKIQMLTRIEDQDY